MYRQIFLAEFDLGKFYVTGHNYVQWVNVAREPHVAFNVVIVILLYKWPVKPSVS